MVLKILCLIFIAIQFVSAKRLSEGDACKNNGAPGICKKFPDCSSAIELLNKQMFPVTCGYAGNVPIICCNDGSSPQTSSTSRTTTSEVPTTSTSAQTTTTQAPEQVTPRSSKGPEEYAVGQLSEQKCAEYGQYAFEQMRPVVLLQGASTINQSVCGFKAVELIVGGTPTKPYEFPHQALLGFQGKDGKPLWKCGGALVSENFVISAAHCAYTTDLGNVTYARLGELDYNDPTDSMPQDFTIIEIIKHPEYAPPAKYHDIMLLRLDKPAVFNKWVRPICLHTEFYIEPTNNQSHIPRFLATGWGRTELAGDVSTILQKVIIDSYDLNECNTTYKEKQMFLPNGVIEETQICAGGKPKNADQVKDPDAVVGDTCQGDSGGPLQIYSKNVYCMYELVGITSFGKACGVLDVPGVYTRVSNYIDWIEKIVWKNVK